MKKLFIPVFLFLIPVLSTAQEYSNDDLSITRLEQDMWVVETTDMTTMYIIEGSEKALLIDTGTKCRNLDKVVREITDKPLYVVITHMHMDHDGNMNYFDSIFFHSADTVLLNRKETAFHGSIRFLEDGDFIDLGNKKIEVIHTPGHTPGSIVLLDHQSGNCYSGDAFGSGQVWLQLKPYSSIDTYISSCEKLLREMNRDITKIYCGHYPYAKKVYDISYLTDMRDLAVMIKNGTEPEPEPHPARIPGIGSPNAVMSTFQQASIVYDREEIK